MNKSSKLLELKSLENGLTTPLHHRQYSSGQGAWTLTFLSECFLLKEARAVPTWAQGP